MIVHENFAQICDGEVKNIIICENYPTADHLTKCVYGNDAFAVDCLQYKCSIGDKYYNNTFYTVDENGEDVALEYMPTQEQEIEQLKAENNELTLALADLIGG